MSVIPWACPRASACRVLFTGRRLDMALPAGDFTLSYDGHVTSVTDAAGGSIGVELDVFDVIQAVFGELYCAGGGRPTFTFPVVDGQFVRTAHYNDDPLAQRQAEHVIWSAVAAAEPTWLPIPLPDEELRARAGVVAAASLALNAARAALRADKNAATIKAAVAADVDLDDADAALAEAHAYQARVTNLRAFVEGIDLVDASPPTSRIPSGRPRGAP